MKTMAIRLDDTTAELLAIVAQLEGTSVIDQIRQAIDAHLAKKAAEGDLAEKAQAALDEIDREASARKDAIGTLLGQPPQGTTPITKGRSRRGSGEPEARLTEPLPIGFAPPQPRGQGGDR